LELGHELHDEVDVLLFVEVDLQVCEGGHATMELVTYGVADV